MADKNSDDFRTLLENHDNMIIQKWNDKVHPEDTVMFLGDFAFGDKKRAEELGRKLNGNKVIVLGNHDNRKYNSDGTIKYNGTVEAHFKACGFYRVSFEPIIISYRGFKIICSHEPHQKYLSTDTTQLYSLGDFYSVFGHCHSKGSSFEIDGKSCCCCIDMPNMELAPIEADTIISKFKKI